MSDKPHHIDSGPHREHIDAITHEVQPERLHHAVPQVVVDLAVEGLTRIGRDMLTDYDTDKAGHPTDYEELEAAGDLYDRLMSERSLPVVVIHTDAAGLIERVTGIEIDGFTVPRVTEVVVKDSAAGVTEVTLTVLAGRVVRDRPNPAQGDPPQDDT